MENKIYYIQGSKENPEGVKQALLEVYPNAENPNCLVFTEELGIYYVLDNIMYFSKMCNTTKIIKMLGEELQPKKQQKFVEKTMYQRIYKDGLEDIHESDRYHSTIEDAMAGEHTIGYKEVKVMIKSKDYEI